MRAWYLWPHGWVALWEWPWSSWWCLLQSDSYVHINAKYIVFLLHSGLFVLEALCVHVRDSFCSPSCSVVLSIMNCHHAALGPRPCHHIGLTQQLYFLPSSSFSNKHISLTQKANHRAPLSCQPSFVSCWHPVRHFGGPTGPFCVSECYLEKCSSCFISSTWLSSCWNNNNVFIVYEGLITVNLVQMMGTAETADGCIPSFITRWLNTICWGVRMERGRQGASGPEDPSLGTSLKSARPICPRCSAMWTHRPVSLCEHDTRPNTHWKIKTLLAVLSRLHFITWKQREWL